ncbi:MAG: YggT family protein [Sphingobacteriales bacterium]|nr:MAG: YggT family protein [Sphingobacteriales bacterium]
MDEDRQTTETRTTHLQNGNTAVERQTVASETAVPGQVIVGRIIYYIVGFITVLLLLRIVLLLLAANQGNGFVDFIYAVSGFFAMPFYGIFNYTPAYGSSILELSSIVAILIYALVGWGLVKLLTIGSRSRNV